MNFYYIIKVISEKSEVMDKRIGLVIVALILISILGFLVYQKIFTGRNDIESPEFSAITEGILDEKILLVTRTRNQCTLKTVNTEGVLSELIGFKTPNPAYHHFSLSHDKKQVAYFSSDNYLTIINIEDGETTRLIEMKQEGGFREIAWSFDGSQLAYVNGHDLYVINTDGSGNKKLAEHQGASYFDKGWVEGFILDLVWSKNGEIVFFDTFAAPFFLSGGSEFNVVNRKICSVNLTSNKVETLLPSALIEGYGPDDMIIIKDYIKINEEYEEDWFLMSYEGNCTEYSWLSIGKLSPDESAIAYVTWDDTLGVRDEATREHFTPEDEIEEVTDLVWSPDGNYIAYVVKTNDIHIIRRDLTHDFCVIQGLGSEEGSFTIELIAWIDNRY